MKFYRKMCAAVLLLLGIAALSFGEEFYGFGTGSIFFTDRFPDDNYLRSQNGANIMMSFYYFPGDFFLGIFAKTSFGSTTPQVEENARESMRARESSIFDFRTAISPSFRIRAGSKLQFPISLGPAIAFSGEETAEKFLLGSGDSSTVNYHYQAISGGINADIAMLFTPSRHFYLRPGIFFDYYFLRAEKGEMRMNYRTTHNKRFEGTSYSAFNFGLNFGIGLRY